MCLVKCVFCPFTRAYFKKLQGFKDDCARDGAAMSLPLIRWRVKSSAYSCLFVHLRICIGPDGIDVPNFPSRILNCTSVSTLVQNFALCVYYLWLFLRPGNSSCIFYGRALCTFSFGLSVFCSNDVSGVHLHDAIFSSVCCLSTQFWISHFFAFATGFPLNSFFSFTT